MKSVGLFDKAFSHVVICAIAIGIGCDETNCPEYKDKDHRADEQHEGGDRNADVLSSLVLRFHVLVPSRLDSDNIHLLVCTGLSCF